VVEAVTCGVCGTGFHARAGAIYCSSACRQKAHRARTALRVAGLEARQPAMRSTRRAFVKPDVAGTIERARQEQCRARELCRTSAEALRESAESHQKLMAVQWLTRAGSATPAPPWSRDGAFNTIFGDSG
jgi:hypothetical protein